MSTEIAQLSLVIPIGVRVYPAKSVHVKPKRGRVKVSGVRELREHNIKSKNKYNNSSNNIRSRSNTCDNKSKNPSKNLS